MRPPISRISVGHLTDEHFGHASDSVMRPFGQESATAHHLHQGSLCVLEKTGFGSDPAPDCREAGDNIGDAITWLL